MSDTVHGHGKEDGATRRDFLTLASAAFGAAGAGLAVWPLVDSMNPAKDVLALASIQVNLEPIAVGQRVTVKWRGKPVFIDHRPPEAIERARAVNVDELRDPQKDEDRVQKPEWLIMVGVCTHLGCVPLGQKQGDPRGEWDGWFCPCHGSHYDVSGRVRKGPAPTNLPVPPYAFENDTTVRIG